jgi:hypothetical protein
MLIGKTAKVGYLIIEDFEDGKLIIILKPILILD